jgi:hypothetical protein
MASMTVERGHPFTPGRGLMLFWTMEALIAVMVAATFLAPLDFMTGRRRAADGIPPGNWFLMHPPIARTLDAVVLESSEPMARWLLQSSDPAYCCWRHWTLDHAYPGFDSEQDCQGALDAYRRRAKAPHALWTVSPSADMALANARCVHATALWMPVEDGAEEE